MQVLCPKCGQTLGGNDINVVTDLARCPSCGEVFGLSTLVQANPTNAVDPHDPPRGAWFREDFNGFEVGTTTRHPIAFFLVPFMCVWSGGSLGGIYGSQIISGQFNLLLSLFGIPFCLGTLLFGSIALMTVCGQIYVRVVDSEGVVFIGVGPLGWRRPFDWKQVTAIRVEASINNNHQPSQTIVLDGPRKLRFGSGVTEVRRDFIADVLRQELANDRYGSRSSG